MDRESACIKFATLLLLGLLHPPTFAWNSLGHKVVADIAWRQLDAPTRQTIVDTLRRHPRFDTDFAAKMEDDALKGDRATQDQWIFQHAATWPDLIRKNKEFDRPKWHYIDLPQFLSDGDRRAFANRLPVNISTEYPTRLPNEEYNVLQAIAYCRATIHSKAAARSKGHRLLLDIPPRWRHSPTASLDCAIQREPFPQGRRRREQDTTDQR